MKLADFKPGDRVRIHPACDWFMKGVVYATITAVGAKWLTAKSDGDHVIKIRPWNILEVV